MDTSLQQWITGHLNVIILCGPQIYLHPQSTMSRTKAEVFHLPLMPCLPTHRSPHFAIPTTATWAASVQASRTLEGHAHQQPGLQKPLLIPRVAKRDVQWKFSCKTLSPELFSSHTFFSRAHVAFSDQRGPPEALAGFSPPPPWPTLCCFDVVRQPLIIDWGPDPL